jgi:aryl-alcohol dehydrogenase-like predicted oxidoreductase
MKLLDLAPISSPALSPDSSLAVSPTTSTGLPFYRKLGRTDLTVSSLGIGGGGNISSEDTLYAFDRGINYFFYSSDLHHFLYSSMTGALRQLCGRGSSVREKVVLATVTYVKNPEMAAAALLDQFVELNLDYIDVFFWGWIGANDNNILGDCLNLSPDLRGSNSVYQRTMERLVGVSEKLKRMGAVRYVGASFHDLDVAQKWLNQPFLDVAMVRHNVAHRSAQDKILRQLDPSDLQRTGIVTFKSAGSHTGPLWQPPATLPAGCWCPSVPDLYRYSLSQENVDVCLTGVQNRDQVDAAIAGLEKGKLTPEELAYLNLYGDLHRQRIAIEEVSSNQLLYRNL